MTPAAAHPRRGLVYDVGVCNGDDSAYYLHLGYAVVGVEANPLWIPALRERFGAEIGEGRYELLAVGIAESEGEADFWVCDDHFEWSSFDRSIASRYGSRHHSVRIPTVRFRSILERFGPAAYCKIDIEGNDELCLDDLTQTTRPSYISVELSHADQQIGRLAELGYTRFKIISQRTLRQPAAAMTALKARMPPLACRLFTAAEVRLARHHPGTWRHPGGSSGPFGEDAHGQWRSADEALRTCSEIRAISHGLWEWFDIHASVPVRSGSPRR